MGGQCQRSSLDSKTLRISTIILQVDILNTLKLLFGISVVSLPVIIFGFRLVVKSGPASLESISYFEDLLTLYFSQYCLSFDKRNKIKSLQLYAKFLFSWFMIIVSLFTFIVFLFSYIFGTSITHSDSLLFLIALWVIGIRFLVFKKGRQRAELFPWIVSIGLFSWVSIGALTRLYAFVAPHFEKLGMSFVTSYFSREINISEPLISSMPSNPYVIFFCFILFLISEHIIFKYLEPSPCGPWSLCYEIHSGIERLIGEAKIVNKAREIIKHASLQKADLIWVTTSKRKSIFESIINSSGLNKVDIVVIGENYTDLVGDKEIPSNITLRSSLVDFPRGFLMIPNQEAMLTCFPIRGMKFGEPSIGFLTKDIAVLARLKSIYNEMH